MDAKQLAATNLAIKNLGGITKASRRYKISIAAVQHWRKRGVPQERINEIEKDSGVAREKLLPHLYRKPVA